MPKSEVRIDKWLWAVRVFKTRTAAPPPPPKPPPMIGDAVAKPARTVKVGDVVKVRKPPVTYSFKVLALTENRLGARLVPEYMENVTPKSELDLLDVVRISGFIDRRKGLGRPTKREGRELSRFTSEQVSDGWDFDFDFDEDDFDDDTDDITPHTTFTGPGR